MFNVLLLLLIPATPAVLVIWEIQFPRMHMYVLGPSENHLVVSKAPLQVVSLDIPPMPFPPIKNLFATSASLGSGHIPPVHLPRYSQEHHGAHKSFRLECIATSSRDIQHSQTNFDVVEIPATALVTDLLSEQI